MMHFVKYAPHDLSCINLQPEHAKWREQLLAPGYAEALDTPGRAWTAIEGKKVLGSGGFSPQWPGRSIAWAVIGTEIPVRAWPRVKNTVKREIEKEMQRQKDECGHARIEFTVPAHFAPGLRLAAALGFTVEGAMPKYGPEGADQYLFAKVA